MPDRNVDHIPSPPKNPARWLPLMTGVCLCLITAVLWWALEQREQAYLRTKIDAEARYLASHLTTDLRSRIPALQRMAKRWEIRGGTPKEEFLSDAAAYFEDAPGYQALVWADSELFVRWLIPPLSSDLAQRLNLAFEANRRAAQEKAKSSRAPAMTAPIDLVTGGKGFQIYCPLYVQGEFQGFVLAVFRIEPWLDHVFRGNDHLFGLEDFSVAVAMDDIPVYRQAGWDNLAALGPQAMAATEILGHRFTVHLRPTPRYIARGTTALPRLTVLFGLVLAGLAALIVHLHQQALREAERARLAKNDLETLVRTQQQTEALLQQALSRLDMATMAGGIGIWSWDVASDALLWNDLMYEMYDIPPDVAPSYATWREAVHPDDLSAVEALLQSAVAGRAVFNTEFRLALPNGVVRYLGAAARVERDATGAARQVIGINWDLTARKKAEEELRESEQRFRALVETTSDWVWAIDHNGLFTYVSPKVEELLGYRPEELIGTSPFALMSPEEATRVGIIFNEIVRNHAPFVGMENANLHKDGRTVVLETAGVPFFDSRGAFAGYRGIDRDITRRKQTEATLAAERQRLANILEGTNVGTWEWNVQSGETVFNERWAEIIGYTLAELQPTTIETWLRFAHPDDLAVSEELLKRHFRQELLYYECEARMRHKNGGWIWILDRGKVATWTADGKPLLMSGTHQDITARKLAEEKINHLATHDSLTGLPSLRLARDHLGLAINLARRQKNLAALMFIDLDGFKEVNDTLGHDAGDEVLKEVANRLLVCARATDTVARLGGDEFLLIASGITRPENGAEIAGKILQALSRPIVVGEHQARVGASIGIAMFPEDGREPDQMIKAADTAMYQVKNAGKNGFAFAGGQRP